MLQIFGEDNAKNNAHRALQAWIILVGVATRRQLITYGGLAELMGYPKGKGAGVLAPILAHIWYYCEEYELPTLTILVVNKGTGRPGEGLSGIEDHDAERERVMNYAWYRLVPPTVEEMSRIFKSEQ